MSRDYAAVARRIRESLPRGASREDRMRLVADALWDSLHATGVSWAGFYTADESQPEDRRLILGPRRDKPACSPIGLHGVCGAGYRTGLVQIVRDTAELGPNYVACDPRDKSEIVIPLFEPTEAERRCWGVLDLDSWDIGTFDDSDAAGLIRVLEAAGFDATAPTNLPKYQE